MTPLIVQPHVFIGRKCDKVLGPVVVLDLVEMMHDFVLGKVPAVGRLPIQSMLQHVTHLRSGRMIGLKDVDVAHNNDTLFPRPRGLLAATVMTEHIANRVTSVETETGVCGLSYGRSLATAAEAQASLKNFGGWSLALGMSPDVVLDAACIRGLPRLHGLSATAFAYANGWRLNGLASMVTFAPSRNPHSSIARYGYRLAATTLAKLRDSLILHLEPILSGATPRAVSSSAGAFLCPQFNVFQPLEGAQ